MNKVIITDGIEVKTLDPWNDETPGAWVGLQAQQAQSERLVPSVFAGIAARVQAAGALPLAVYSRKGDTELDNSDNWKNVVGCLPDPGKWLSRAEGAICTYGRGYWYIERGAKTAKPKNLVYWQPATIVPKIDKDKGLMNFERTVTHQTYQPEQILYVWPPDPDVELGPPLAWPLRAALTAAGANDAINKWVGGYMNRGAVKAMLLSVEGMPDQAEADRLETWFNRFMRGLRFNWKVFNASGVKPTVIGDGLEALKGMTINAELRYEVHTALGTRHMLEDENYATAQIRARQFYVQTVIPSAKQCVSDLNTQVLHDLGYHIEIEPERMQEFQTEESDRATALAQLTDAGMPLLAALDVLGFDLSDEAMAIIQAQESEPKEPAEPVSPELVKALVELDRWEAKVKAAGKPITWHVFNVPAPVAGFVNDALKANGRDPADIFKAAREKLRTIPPPMTAKSDSAAEAIAGKLDQLISQMKAAATA